MPLEREGYRNNLARLDEKFPNKELLTTREVADYFGIDMRTARKYYPFRNGYISKAELARTMSL